MGLVTGFKALIHSPMPVVVNYDWRAPQAKFRVLLEHCSISKNLLVYVEGRARAAS